jgi:hypothetical protein
MTVKALMALRWLRGHKFTGFTPWHFVEGDVGREGLRRELQLETSGGPDPALDFYPFATRQDRDDVAGFLIRDGVITTEVLVVHLTWRRSPEGPGWPMTARFESIWAWLKSVIDDAAEWCAWADEDDLAELERESE